MTRWTFGGRENDRAPAEVGARFLHTAAQCVANRQHTVRRQPKTENHMGIANARLNTRYCGVQLKIHNHTPPVG